MTGTAGSEDADFYDPNDPCAIAMSQGTEWFTFLFILSYYGISLDEYIEQYGDPPVPPPGETQ